MVCSRTETGFTLIELVIAIILVGVLVATIFSKFESSTDKSRIALSTGVVSAFSEATGVAHAQWLATGSPATITMNGATVVMSKSGWPEATSKGLADNIATKVKCLEVWNGIFSNQPRAGITCTGDCQYLVRVSSSQICEYIDEQGSGDNVIRYDITTGAVTLN